MFLFFFSFLLVPKCGHFYSLKSDQLPDILYLKAISGVNRKRVDASSRKENYHKNTVCSLQILFGSTYITKSILSTFDVSDIKLYLVAALEASDKG